MIANNAGRVGALAVAVGVGTALAAAYGSGVAHADSESSTQTTKKVSSDSSDDSGQSSGGSAEKTSPTSDSVGDSATSPSEQSRESADDNSSGEADQTAESSQSTDTSTTETSTSSSSSPAVKSPKRDRQDKQPEKAGTPRTPAVTAVPASDDADTEPSPDPAPAAVAATDSPDLAVVVPAEIDDPTGSLQPPVVEPAAVTAVMTGLTTALSSSNAAGTEGPVQAPLVLALLASARREIEQIAVSSAATMPTQKTTVEVRTEDVADPAIVSLAAVADATVAKPDALDAPDTTPTDNAVLLSWAAPEEDTEELTRFSLRYRTHGGTWAFADDAPANATAAVIAGLESDTAYEFAVRASNVFGNSPWSNSALTLTSGQAGNPLPNPSPSPSPSPSPGPNPSPGPDPDPAPAPGNVLWQDRFDSAPVGNLTKASGDAVFGSTVAPTSGATYVNGAILTDPEGGKFLRHTIPAGQLGAFIVTPEIGDGVEHAVLEYDIRFDDNFDWRWGGKIPGLVGVAPGQSIFAPTSGRSNRSAGFSTRLMWHGRGDDGSRPFQGKLGPIPAGADNELVTYAYAPTPAAGFGGYGWHTNLGTEMQRGQWQRVRMEVKLNTVGAKNGVYKVWVDDRLVYSASDWEYRTRPDVKIDAVLYDIHRGGGTTPPSWVSSRNTYIDLRNMTVRDPASVL